jgi:hypothetical protein
MGAFPNRLIDEMSPPYSALTTAPRNISRPLRSGRRWTWLNSDSRLQSEADLSLETRPASGASDQAILKTQIARGVKDENKLTDALFYQRHPELKNKALRNANAALRSEWLRIRDALVRPLLKYQKAPTPQSVPLLPSAAPSISPAKPAPLPSRKPGAGLFGWNNFDFIRQYKTAEFVMALAAQGSFQRVKSFLPWYQKIMNAVPNVGISLDSHGIGNLVFSMDGRAFRELVESKELINKVVETFGSAMIGRLEFTVDFIGLLGLGATLLDIARGIENERMLGGVGPQYDEWRNNQARKFVIGLLAEDLSRRDLRNSIFINRDARSLATEIMNYFNEFQPLYYSFFHYILLEDQLAQQVQLTGTVPDILPRQPDIMRPYP